MTKAQLQDIFSSPFSMENWLIVLKKVFNAKNLFQEPRKISLIQNDLASAAFELGSFYTHDERLVGIYMVQLFPKAWIERNRISLRNLFRDVYKYSVDGALIVFVQDKKWRFSYVSEIRTIEGEKKTEPRRYTYLFGVGETCRTAADRFEKLVGNPITLDDLYEAFSVEKLNKGFFKSYKEFFGRFSAHLADNELYRRILLGNPELLQKGWQDEKAKPIRDFSKKLLGRMVFLQFLQKKGWMGVPASNKDWSGGDVKFLQTLFLQCPDKQNFHSKYLKALFFETLNRKRGNNLAPDLLGIGIKIPYLNGGLFDFDIAYSNEINFPVDLFDDLLSFFESYNFTIDENDPFENEVGIDPEMLGHIFENLLEENREKGAFYTPKEIVHYMCQESLIQYLRTYLPECTEDESPATKSLEQFIRMGLIGERNDRSNFVIQNARRIEKLLDEVKVCDPAIGSGAFPMGLLQEIFKAKISLDLTLDPALVKKQIIQNCIYGVDLENGAVEIARLRFWLALVVDESEPQPLPNLDYKIMQGNSLLEQFEGIPLQNLQSSKRVLYSIEGDKQMTMFDHSAGKQIRFDVLDDRFNELESYIDRYFETDSPENKSQLKTQINQIIHEHLHFNIDLRKAKQEIELAENMATFKAIRFDKNDSAAKRRLKEKQLEVLKRQIEKVEKEIDRLTGILNNLNKIQDSDSRPYFLWHLMFREVFDQGGFDIVIGNPPYIQLAKLKDPALENAGYETFKKDGDIYCLFYELGVRLLKPKGVLTYITSNSWMQTQYGRPLRNYFVEKANPISLLNFTDTRLFDTAVVETNIITLSKNKFQKKFKAANLDQTFRTYESIASFVENQGYIIRELSPEGWSVGDEKGMAIKSKMDKNGVILKYWDIRIDYGIKTGFNEAFIIPEDVKNKLINEDPKSVEIIKPTLRGRDLKRYSFNFSDQWIITTFPSLDIDINHYPAVREYLLGFGKERLDQSGNQGSRKKTANEWFETQDQITYYELFEEPKIIWGELSDEAKFTYDEEGHYLNNTMFMLTGSRLKYLLAVLNSKAAQWYFQIISTTSGMGTNRWLKYKIEQLAVPSPDDRFSKWMEILVDKVLLLKKEKGNTSLFENKLDALVFHQYGLNEEEMTYILDSFGELSIKDRNQIQNEFWNIANDKFQLDK